MACGQSLADSPADTALHLNKVTGSRVELRYVQERHELLCNCPQVHAWVCFPIPSVVFYCIRRWSDVGMHSPWSVVCPLLCVFCPVLSCVQALVTLNTTYCCTSSLQDAQWGDEPEAEKRRQDHDMNNLREQVTIKREMLAASNEPQVAWLTHEGGD